MIARGQYRLYKELNDNFVHLQQNHIKENAIRDYDLKIHNMRIEEVLQR